MAEEAVISTPGAVAVAAASFLILLAIGDIVDMSSGLLGCVFRWKENVNLYNNMKMRRARNRIFMALMPASVIVVSYYDLSPAGYGVTEAGRFLEALLAVSGYYLLRMICKCLFCGRQWRSGDFQCASQTSYTFAIIGVLAVLVVSGILNLAGAGKELSVSVIMWTSIAIYMIFLLREYQVFASFRGYSAAFLYLCALEILPTGLLAASYFIF